MSKQFVKNSELSLENGGYLTFKGNPVNNSAFVVAQQRAEYVVTYAKLAKGKNFVTHKADSLINLQNEVNAELNKNKPTTFISTPTLIEIPFTTQLKVEAYAFMNFQDNILKTDKINQFLQEFVVLADYEQFGLFFEEDIVKLNKIYTLQEVIEAVTEVIDLLN